MKTIDQWFSEYAVSHQNSTNKFIHWICVPTIFFSIVGLLYSLKLGATNLAHLALFFVVLFYFRLSWKMAFAMMLFAFICLFICNLLEQNTSTSLNQICLILFVLAWIGQFIGHKIEGKKPSFLNDIQFLMIGPAWLLGFIFKKLNIKY
jgi:uncharacterized membrane protein YGL010W